MMFNEPIVAKNKAIALSLFVSICHKYVVAYNRPRKHRVRL